MVFITFHFFALLDSWLWDFSFLVTENFLLMKNSEADFFNVTFLVGGERSLEPLSYLNVLDNDNDVIETLPAAKSSHSS